jgi:cytochrome c biogenesis protein CcdA
MRCWGPLLAAVVCLAATAFAGVILDWLLMMLAFGLILDGVTAWWERAGGTGNLTTYRQ